MRIELNELWQLRHEELSVGSEDAAWVADREGGWLPASLPCDIHVPLIEAGLIKDPVLADYSYACDWTEKKSWWFRKEFEVTGEALAAAERAELVLEGIDALAFVFVNGRLLGRHESAHFPFVADARPFLKPGANLLLVRVTSGVEEVTEREIDPFNKSIAVEFEQGRGDRGDKRRAFVRKPQYVFGWDWGPRIATCGLTGKAWLDLVRLAVPRRASVRTLRIEGGTDKSARAGLAIDVEIDQLHDFSTREAEVVVEIRKAGPPVGGPSSSPALVTARREVLLRSGINHVEFELTLENPELWWPNGYGKQPLYELAATATVEGDLGGAFAREAVPALRETFGVRTVELDVGKLPEGGRRFSFLVNGLPIFCKGADWIPADSIYARVSGEKYAKLIDEARSANFTMLRMWGGGIYEPDLFFRLCDEAGILVWQDFMYACACYPDRDEAFYRLAEREAKYQIERLRNHPCLALWCGNNESTQGFDEWWSKDPNVPAYLGGARIYNELLPELVRSHSPGVPYWNSSPYGGAHPNSSEVGDRHHWGDCMMNAEMEKRIAPEEFDLVTAKFVSEYGYPGPCARETIERYHDGAPLDPESRIWKLHNNTFEKDTVRAGIAKHYIDPAGLTLDDYIEFASACQSLMLGYSLESLRSKSACSGALFWMYNDCWGEVGWTIVDYYLRRKPSWYAVRRALAPRRLILRRDPRNGQKCRVTMCNECGTAYEGEIEYGWLSFDGTIRESRTARVSLAAAERSVVVEFDLGDKDETKGCFFAATKESTSGIEASTLRPHADRAFMSAPCSPVVSDARRHPDGRVQFSVSSATFAHGVHFHLGDGIRPSDEYFDLLPGETRWITLSGSDGEKGLPEVRASALNRKPGP